MLDDLSVRELLLVVPVFIIFKFLALFPVLFSTELVLTQRMIVLFGHGLEVVPVLIDLQRLKVRKTYVVLLVLDLLLKLLLMVGHHFVLLKVVLLVIQLLICCVVVLEVILLLEILLVLLVVVLVVCLIVVHLKPKKYLI